MKILSGQNLVDTVRELSDNAKKRLWIAVPYLGSYKTVQEILGSSWLKKFRISLKLLTDISELNTISAASITSLKQRVKVRSLRGLHAKIYVIDDCCILGSANLTRTAFTKRYEVAILLSPSESSKAVKLFESFWEKGGSISDAELLINKRTNPREDEGISQGLVTLSKLHQTNIVEEGSLSIDLSFEGIVDQFNDFAKNYQIAIGRRIWINTPIHYEVDSFLNYMFNEAPRRPSHPYKYSKGRRLDTKQQIKILKKYTKLFKEHTKEYSPKEYKDATRTIRRNLSKNNYRTLGWEDIKEMLFYTHSGGSLAINIKKATNPKNNNLNEVRQLLYNLVSGNEQLDWRRYECYKRVFGIGKAQTNEILHFYNPNIYPLINLRSCSGLRFFGYRINQYRASKKRTGR